jgi:hypothetical protein
MCGCYQPKKKSSRESHHIPIPKQTDLPMSWYCAESEGAD